jgi:large subunit ribosomal protein L10
MRHEKQLLLDEIKNKIVESKSFILTRYNKMKANSAWDFRGTIAKVGGDYEVVRKRILIKAAAEAGINLDINNLEGHIGVVFPGSDPIETTKVVFQYGQNNEKAVEVLGAHLDGRLYLAKDVETLSKLPGKNEMRSQLLGLFEAPMAQTLAVMEALLTSVIYCLDNKGKEEKGK